MTSTTENTFGAKLRRAQDLLTFISGFTNYAPPRSEESIDRMGNLINSIITTNSTESSYHANYKVSVDKRQSAFSKSEGSVEKLISPIKGAIDAQYGKKSTEAEVVNSIIKKMRATKLTKSPADPTKEKQEATVSQSERSYGSMTQFFNDIVSKLSQFQGYNPSNNILKIDSLKSIATHLTTLNNEVAKNTQLLKTIRTTRQEQYADLKDRVQRIKSYVKAQYGVQSTEYNLIKGLSV